MLQEEREKRVMRDGLLALFDLLPPKKKQQWLDEIEQSIKQGLALSLILPELW
jgi:hypothetical protein